MSLATSGQSVSYYAPIWRDLRIAKPGFRKPVELPTNILPILAFDPGGHTGWSLLRLNLKAPDFTGDNKCIFTDPNLTLRDMLTNRMSRIHWEHGEIDCSEYEHSGKENKGVYDCMSLVDTWPSAVVIIEDFILQKLNKGRDLLSPVRIGSKIEYQLYKQGRTVQWQLPAAAKTTVSDARLKELQLYDSRGGFEHARDADRHVVLFIRRCLGNTQPAKELRHKAWPHIFNERGDLVNG